MTITQTFSGTKGSFALHYNVKTWRSTDLTAHKRSFILFWSKIRHNIQHSFLCGEKSHSISCSMAFSLAGQHLHAGDQSRFENMIKLLLFLEAELQLKEEIIDLLLVCTLYFRYHFYLVYRTVAKHTCLLWANSRRLWSLKLRNSLVECDRVFSAFRQQIYSSVYLQPRTSYLDINDKTRTIFSRLKCNSFPSVLSCELFWRFRVTKFVQYHIPYELTFSNS